MTTGAIAIPTAGPIKVRGLPVAIHQTTSKPSACGISPGKLPAIHRKDLRSPITARPGPLRLKAWKGGRKVRGTILCLSTRAPGRMLNGRESESVSMENMVSCGLASWRMHPGSGSVLSQPVVLNFYSGPSPHAAHHSCIFLPVGCTNLSY